MKRSARVAGVAVLTLSGLALIGTGSVGASTPSFTSVTSGIEAAATVAKDVRTAFFCSTTSCTTNRAANLKIAEAGVSALASTLKSLPKVSVPSALKPTVNKFAQDADALISAFDVAPSAKTNSEVESISAILSYSTANLTSDVYVFNQTRAGKPIAFRQWGVGVVSVLYAIAMDSETISKNPNSPSVIVNADEDQLLEGKSLLNDANGPNAAFNAMIATFAKHQITVSTALVNSYEKKKVNLTSAQLGALEQEMQTEYSQIQKRQNQLAS